MNNEGKKIALLIIDPQNDFCSSRGSLFVEGADEDNNRLANWILERKEELDQIIVTLDSHYTIDISHPTFWVDENGDNPEPFTIIKAQDLIDGKYKTAYDMFNQGIALTYLEKLEEQGEFEHCIWPEHCITGTWGSAVDTVISGCLREWSLFGKDARFVRYITKGSHPMTEHFGAFKAQVAIANANETHVNMSLIEQLDSFDIIYLAGQAESHCVATSLKQIMDLAPNIAKKFVVLTDTMSPVPGFENLADSIYESARELGVGFEKTLVVNQ
jgi:nicotinamidase-related amidase